MNAFVQFHKFIYFIYWQTDLFLNQMRTSTFHLNIFICQLNMHFRANVFHLLTNAYSLIAYANKSKCCNGFVKLNICKNDKRSNGFHLLINTIKNSD